jgi:hypothetical protein
MYTSYTYTYVYINNENTIYVCVKKEIEKKNKKVLKKNGMPIDFFPVL